MPIDMSAAAKAPPRKSAARRTVAASNAAKTPVETRTPNELRNEGLHGLGQLLQFGCVAGGLYADAATIGMHGPSLFKAVADIADEYEQVAKPIDFLIKLGPFSALIAAGMPMVLQILANHRIVDGSRMASQGVVPPEVLESQMRAEMARAQAEAMRENQRAIAEARQAEQEMNDYLASVQTPAA